MSKKHSGVYAQGKLTTLRDNRSGGCVLRYVDADHPRRGGRWAPLPLWGAARSAHLLLYPHNFLNLETVLRYIHPSIRLYVNTPIRLYVNTPTCRTSHAGLRSTTRQNPVQKYFFGAGKPSHDSVSTANAAITRTPRLRERRGPAVL